MILEILIPLAIFALAGAGPAKVLAGVALSPRKELSLKNVDIPEKGWTVLVDLDLDGAPREFEIVGTADGTPIRVSEAERNLFVLCTEYWAGYPWPPAEEQEFSIRFAMEAEAHREDLGTVRSRAIREDSRS